jgi:formylglycine-generating enzyme required for sulfatase activity
MSGSVFTQAEKPFDPKELTAVQKIRARIEEQGKKATAGPPAAYKVTIPNTTVSYGMAAIPAGEFLMGSAGPGAAPDEQPQHKVRLDAFWMQTHEVTWDS